MELAELRERVRKLPPEKRAELASRLGAVRPSTGGESLAPCPERRATKGPYLLGPASEAQRQIWLAQQALGEIPAYNSSKKIYLAGPLEEVAWRGAWQALAQRHEALRTTFRLIGGQVHQVVETQTRMLFETVDLGEQSKESQNSRLAELAGCWTRQPFDLETGPLWRVGLVRLGVDQHAVIAVFHHLIFDDWSVHVLLRDLAEIYGGILSGLEPNLPALPIQHVDYVCWQARALNGPQMDRLTAYWNRQLDGAAMTLDLLHGAPTRVRWASSGAHLRKPLPTALREELTRLARTHEVTLFMVLFAAYNVLLWRSSGTRDLVLGVPFANRSRRETEDLIGCFMRLLPLRSQLAADMSFVALLRQVKRVVLEAHDHAEVPFQQLLRKLRGEAPQPVSEWYQHTFQLRNVPRAHFEVGRLSGKVAPLETGAARVVLGLHLVDQDGELTGDWEYNNSVFSSHEIEFLEHRWQKVLQAVVADPGAPLESLNNDSSLPLASRFDQTLSELLTQSISTVVEQFQNCVRNTPNAVAVVDGNCELSYHQLNVAANQLAHELIDLGVGPESWVAILIQRSAQAIVGILATLKAGAGYLPLDPRHPRERLRKVMSDASPAVALTAQGKSDLHGTSVVLDLEATDTRSRIASRLVIDPVDVEGMPRAKPHHSTYLMYTSGSTGRPKGVVIEHRSLANFLAGLQGHFPFHPGIRHAANTTLSFDISVLDLFGPLTRGATVVVVPDSVVGDREHFLNWIREKAVNSLQATPSYFAVLTQEPTTALKGMQLLSGAEALPRELARQLAMAGKSIHNIYGPTEICIYCSAWKVTERDFDDSAPATVSIGLALPGYRFHLLDDRLQEVSNGETGEIFVAGLGVARGYLNRPELTAERFIRHPAGRADAERMYRTGDLARRRPDGSLEFLGRRDHQVKIRGFRIELGEIESALMAQPGVAQAVALAREDGPDGQLLTAYVVPQQSQCPQPERLRDALALRLPDYMIPSAWVMLEKLPLTPNGKLDRRALPPPTRQRSEYQAPRGLGEERLCALFAEVLRLERVGRNDDFFSRGGNSLLGMRLAGLARKRWGCELPIRKLFSDPSPAALAPFLVETAPLLPPIQRMERPELIPLSFAQLGLWMVDQVEGGADGYNITRVSRIRGPLDISVLERSFQAVILRHESLRTRFLFVDGFPCQVIDAHIPRLLRVEDWVDRDSQTRESDLTEALRSEARQLFNLEKDPMIRALLIRLGPSEHVLVRTCHHIVSDGASEEILSRELGVYYNMFLKGAPDSLPPLAIQFVDFVLWQREWFTDTLMERDLEYWRLQLLIRPPELALPSDRPRQRRSSGFAGKVSVYLAPSDFTAVREVGRRHQVTLFTTLLCTFGSLLQRLSGQNDILVGSPFGGRPDLSLEPLVGLFVNTAVLRLRIRAGSGFGEFLKETQAMVMEAFEHQHLPFHRVVEAMAPQRDGIYSPLVQTVFVLQNGIEADEQFEGCQVEKLPSPEVHARFDLELHARECPEGLKLDWIYDCDLFDRGRIEAWAEGYLNILRAAIEDANRARVSSPVPGVGDADRSSTSTFTIPDHPRDATLPQLGGEQVLRSPGAIALRADPSAPLASLDMDSSPPHAIRFKETGAGSFIESSQTAVEWFQEWVKKTPHAVAVVEGDIELSYHDLNVSANQLAHELIDLGAGPESWVAVLIERSVQAIVGILATLKVGAGYLPLDPRHPRERLRETMLDARPTVVLTAGGRNDLQAAALTLDLEDAETRSRIAGRLETDPVDVKGMPRAKSHHPAYLIYTSGSTGRPKGVVIEHRSLANLLAGIQGYFPFHPGIRHAANATLCFDVSVLDILGPLIRGATVVVAPDSVVGDPELFLSWLGEKRVNSLQATPSYFAVLTQSNIEALRGLQLLSAGEALPRDLARKLVQVGELVCNGYGPTETFYCSAWVVTSEDLADSAPASVTLGQALPGHRFHVLNDRLEEVPIGETGEICVSGIGLSRGYLNRPELTAERFIRHPAGGADAERMYRTGDLARRRPDGTLEFLGRRDHQVKIRGFRIELGEIESALMAQPGVAHAVVLAREDGPDGQLLVAYVVPHRGQSPQAESLREALAARLPDYMVPSAWVMLEQLPLTPNGKLDRRALPPPVRELSQGEAPRNLGEERLCALFAEVLRLERVGRNDDFFRLGGNSLLAMRLAGLARRKWGCELPVRWVFSNPNPAALAPFLLETAPSTPSLKRFERPKSIPLSFAQLGLWLVDQVEGGTDGYNITRVLRIRGPLDISALDRGFKAVILRHESLRTRFDQVDGVPHQVIDSQAPLPLRLEDWGGRDPDRMEPDLANAVQSEARQPFDLRKGPFALDRSAPPRGREGCPSAFRRPISPPLGIGDIDIKSPFSPPCSAPSDGCFTGRAARTTF